MENGQTGTYSGNLIPANLRGVDCEVNTGVTSMAFRRGKEILVVSGAYRIGQTRLLAVLFLP